MATSFKAAKEAYLELRESGKLGLGEPWTRTLDAFFEVPATILSRTGYIAGQAAYPLGVANRFQAMMTGPDCPDPVRWGNDQSKCPRCGRVWDNDEDRPDCGQARE